MRVGVVKEVTPAERRVALTPAGADALTRDGHQVLVQTGSGAGSDFDDAAYRQAGARVVRDAEEVWGLSTLLVKVKEPLESEYGLLRPALALLSYLHLAANPSLVDALICSGASAIGYETVEDDEHRLPLLTPMSEIAGRLATQAGAYLLQAPLGGPGVLIGGAPGVAPARVLVIGGGVVGTHAARVACGMGAQVTILEQSLPRLRALEEYFAGRALVLKSDAFSLEAGLRNADLVICAVLIPGSRAPHLITREMLGLLRKQAVVVDVAVDQGGCVETSHPTTHDEPTFEVDGVLHYCVANMPGAVPATSTGALTNATLGYVRRLASLGVDAALAEDEGLAKGLNVRAGKITYLPVAEAHAATAMGAA